MPDDAPSFYETIAGLERAGTAFVLVILIEARGSVPQDTGAKMIVTSAGRHLGTVGGGRVEARAIAHAQGLLAEIPAPSPDSVNWSLRADVGMTCGGTVRLYFEPHAGADTVWPIAVFGAGHIAQALLPVLLPLPCTVTVCDSRPEWLAKLPSAPNLRVRHLETPADLVPQLPDHAFVLCLTQGHTTDRPVLQRALSERNFPYVAVIGSAAKAAILRRELRAAGLTPTQVRRFHCPAGLTIGTNHPHEIALSIAAQLLQERDRLARRPR